MTIPLTAKQLKDTFNLPINTEYKLLECTPFLITRYQNLKLQIRHKEKQEWTDAPILKEGEKLYGAPNDQVRIVNI
jgi:hypothetical protein